MPSYNMQNNFDGNNMQRGGGQQRGSSRGQGYSYTRGSGRGRGFQSNMQQSGNHGYNNYQQNYQGDNQQFKPPRQNYKTELCKYYQQGNCPYNQKCSFAHGQQELKEKHHQGNGGNPGSQYQTPQYNNYQQQNQYNNRVGYNPGLVQMPMPPTPTFTQPYSAQSYQGGWVQPMNMPQQQMFMGQQNMMLGQGVH